jgi:hypothetical protein
VSERPCSLPAANGEGRWHLRFLERCGLERHRGHAVTGSAFHSDEHRVRAAAQKVKRSVEKPCIAIHALGVNSWSCRFNGGPGEGGLNGDRVRIFDANIELRISRNGDGWADDDSDGVWSGFAVEEDVRTADVGFSRNGEEQEEEQKSQ